MKMQFLISALFLFLIPPCTGKTLKMVHLLYRHGARSPIRSYPTDPYQFKDWPDGAGRLTQKGMNMEYDLGKFLRKRYMKDNKFLNETYHHREVRIRSSDKERCIQSAEAQLAGLYPPQGYQIWNKDIPWQPIPVHTVEKAEDVALRGESIPCPRLYQIWKGYLHRPDVIKKIAQSKEFLAKASNYSGLDLSNPYDLYSILDPTIAETTEGWPISDALQELMAPMFELYYWWAATRYSGTDELGRLTGGTLLGMMNKNMKMFSEKEHLEELYKLNMYSAHDTTLLSFSTALDVTIEFPNFAACIMVELYEIDGQQFVEMYHRNTHTDEVMPLRLKKCSHSCPLHEFLRLTKPRTTEDRRKICGIHGRSLITLFNLEVLVVGLSGLSLFLLLLLLHFITKKSAPGSKENQYKTLEEVGCDNTNKHCVI